MIRSEILEAIRDAMPSEVQHVALWNHNVEFVEMDSAWSRPAVFVEFDTMQMQATKARTYRIRGVLRLHIVIDFDIYDETAIFGLSDDIVKEMVGINGEGFGITDVQAIYTNHNHEDLVEEVVAFGYSAEYSINS